jgi:hypothetical protein
VELRLPDRAERGYWTPPDRRPAIRRQPIWWLEVGGAVGVILARGVRREVAEAVEAELREHLRVRGEDGDQVVPPGRSVDLVFGLDGLGDAAGCGRCRGSGKG